MQRGLVGSEMCIRDRYQRRVHGEELVTIVVELGMGREESIVVNLGDKAEDLAIEFIRKHNLQESLLPKLTDNIQANIDQALIEIVQQEGENEEQKVEPSPGEEGMEPQEFIQEEYVNAKGCLEAPVRSRPMTVFERLHKEALLKQRKENESKNQKVMEALMEVRNEDLTRSPHTEISDLRTPGKAALNYGSRLYQKGVKMKEEIERKCCEAKKDQEIRQMKYHTFKPMINLTSKLITETAHSQPGRPEDRLLRSGNLINEKKQQQRTVFLIEDKLRCPFHPELNKVSEDLAMERYNIQNSRFSFLFEDANKRKEYQNRLEKIVPDTECTFHPDIAVSQAQYTSKSFLYENKQIKSPSKMLQPSPNPEEYFHPKICRGPSADRSRRGAPIGDRLYSDTKRKAHKLERSLAMQKEMTKSKCNTSFVQKESEKNV
eukprot:TRINITY_DN6020_c0_g1_i1.p1 TRINITY_DN6020_c0_g1~~TRINITY_DN6020_c0_g1_i1.p1  ORF type:complete len:433 (-),score=102.28 TRINITY_DN6020_c0_g1_i1:546-1844(-)